MLGWMCCMQWEHWDQVERRRPVGRPRQPARPVARVASHASVVLWANGSEAFPRTRSSTTTTRSKKSCIGRMRRRHRGRAKNRTWSGIHMVGPYVWRPPYYWFSDTMVPRGLLRRGGRQSDNPAARKPKKFIPPIKLWPPNDVWYCTRRQRRRQQYLGQHSPRLDHRYGPSSSVEELARKAQSRTTRMCGRNTKLTPPLVERKMVMHWMMNYAWPSFGQL